MSINHTAVISINYTTDARSTKRTHTHTLVISQLVILREFINLVWLLMYLELILVFILLLLLLLIF